MIFYWILFIKLPHLFLRYFAKPQKKISDQAGQNDTYWCYCIENISGYLKVLISLIHIYCCSNIISVCVSVKQQILFSLWHVLLTSNLSSWSFLTRYGSLNKDAKKNIQISTIHCQNKSSVMLLMAHYKIRIFIWNQYDGASYKVSYTYKELAFQTITLSFEIGINWLYR